MNKIILMVVDNTCEYDTRVIKEAESLANSKYDVVVLCRQLDGKNCKLTRNRVIYWHHIKQLPGSSIYYRLSSLVKKQKTEFNDNRRNIAKSFHEDSVKVTDQLKPDNNRDDSNVTNARYNVFIIKVAKGLLSSLMGIVRLFRPICLLNPVRSAIEQVKPDFVHVHDLVPLFAATTIASKRNIKVIYDSHELEGHRIGRKELLNLFVSLLEKYTIRQAQSVITVCDSIADHLAKKYTIKRPEVILNTPDLDNVCNDDHNIREVLGLGQSVPLVVYVGKITKCRGLEQTIKAVNQTNGVHFAMVGPEHEPTKNYLQQLAAGLGLTDRIYFVKSVAPQCIVDFVASADIGIIPTQNESLSYYYSLPNKLFEMSFAGLALCVSDFPEHRKYIEEFQNGVFMDSSDPVSIAYSIMFVLENREKYKPEREKLEHMRSLYGWAQQAIKLKNMYDSIAI